ncbi:rod shape-determining protein MreC [Neisseria animalis]|uniref:Cell shape-determining protein MreC n=1 Tax=Neisseria animalis TaxID=492 RepID=A0A5P3MRW2_NEIAN|nr:rod shape-determining protein MreC [Neisseria animalis]QEY24346.1 rod shape-determining protein MreC [Neisseria animalis]ROW31747.1 rod shape-determining protein MreC [Neisseria animalis]VEE06838.1 rod shape-determining protein MreC [Neisseria animalis]
MRSSSLRFGGAERKKLLWRFTGYVVLAVALMLLDSRFAAVQTLRQAAATAMYPLQWLANQPVRLYRHVENLARSQADLLSQNRELLEENGRLQMRLQRDQVNRNELAELKKLYALQQRDIGAVVGAEVISNGKDPLSEKLILDKGSIQGLSEGDAVIDQNGLIGQVTQVQPYSAEVTLISGKRSVVPVMVARTGERSLIYGSGSNVELRYFPMASDLQPNDVLLTSGLDSVYPPGIPVATLGKVVRASGTPYYETELVPFAGLRGSRFVLVLPSANNNNK